MPLICRNHIQPARAVKGVISAAYSSIHQPAAVNDCLCSSRPSTSLTSDAGTNAAVKFTRIGCAAAAPWCGNQPPWASKSINTHDSLLLFKTADHLTHRLAKKIVPSVKTGTTWEETGTITLCSWPACSWSACSPPAMP